MKSEFVISPPDNWDSILFCRYFCNMHHSWRSMRKCIVYFNLSRCSLPRYARAYYIRTCKGNEIGKTKFCIIKICERCKRNFNRHVTRGMFSVSGLVLLDSTENPDLCVYCDTAWPHICLPCLRSSGMCVTSYSMMNEYLKWKSKRRATCSKCKCVRPTVYDRQWQIRWATL